MADRSPARDSACSTCCCTRDYDPVAATRRGRRRRPLARGRPAGGRGHAAGSLRSLHAVVRPYLCRRLCGGLLQLQVGRSPLGRRLQPVRGSTACCRRRRAPGSATKCSPAAAAGRRWSRSSPSAAAPPQLDALLRHNGMVIPHRGRRRGPSHPSHLHSQPPPRGRRGGCRRPEQRLSLHRTRMGGSSTPTTCRRPTRKNVQTKRLTPT